MPPNPLDYTIQDADAMRYALMNDSSYRGGGAVHMEDGGFLNSVYRNVVPAHLRTFGETLMGDRTPITEKNFTPSELDQMRNAVMSSRKDREITNARVFDNDVKKAFASGASDKELMAIMQKGPSQKIDQTVGYQHYPGGDTGLRRDMDLTDDAAIRSTLGRFAYNKDANGNLIATDNYKFTNDLPKITRPTSDYADMNTPEKLWTLAKDTAQMGGLETLPSRVGNAFIGADGRPVNVNLGAAPFAHGGAVRHFDEGGEVSQSDLDRMKFELAQQQHPTSPVMQATPRSPIQDFIGTAGGYMDKAGRFMSEALEPIAESHPVHNYLGNMILAAPLKSAGTALQDYTGTVRETDKENPVRGLISKDWRNLTTSREPMLDPRVLDVAQFAAPVVSGATKLLGAGAKAAAPFATKVDDMVRELHASGAIPQPGLSIKDVTPSSKTTHIGSKEFDPRFDPRVKEQKRINATTTTIEPRGVLDVPKVSLVDFEGYPFITSMADRTAAGGTLTGVNDVVLKRPINLQGGQDYMFENPGQVWASGEHPVRQLMMQANAMKEITGKDPLYMPWRMAPTGGDFAHMTGETMLSYAESNMGKGAKKSLDKQIKKLVPDWKGIDSPESIDQYRELPDATRKALKQMMDVDFRDRGGLNIGQARLAVADPRQVNAPETNIMNVGKIFADRPIITKSGHVSYPHGVPGEGVGIIDQPRSVFELLPKVAAERKIPDVTSPRTTDIRAMQMKPYMGIIDEKLLKSLGYKAGGKVSIDAMRHELTQRLNNGY